MSDPFSLWRTSPARSTSATVTPPRKLRLIGGELESTDPIFADAGVSASDSFPPVDQASEGEETGYAVPLLVGGALLAAGAAWYFTR